MLLVMASAGVLQPESYLWTPTWRAIDTFLPNLKAELFPEPPPPQPAPPSPPQSQSPTSQLTSPHQGAAVLSLVDQQQPCYPKPIPPQPEDQQPCSSPISQSPPSDTSILSTSPRLQEIPQQQQQYQQQQQQQQQLQTLPQPQPVTPVKIVLPSLVLDSGKEPQQVITLVNQPPPSVSSPVAVQPPTTTLYRPVVQEQQMQQEQYHQQVYPVELNAQDQQLSSVYQSEYRQQTVSIKETSSPTKHQYAHLPQMQDFQVAAYAESVKNVAADCSNQTEVRNDKN